MMTNWRAADPESLYWRSWDGEFVVYNDASGDTHCFTAEAAAILRLLADGPRDRGILLQTLSQSMERPPDAELERHLDDILEAFAGAGLVEGS